MATLTERLKAAYDTYRHGYPMQRKDAPFVWPSFREGKPQWQIVDYESYVRDGFDLNSLIYSAIMYKVRAGTSALLRAYKGEVDEPETLNPTHPLSKLLMRPNTHQSWVEFQSMSIVYVNIAGNSYTYMDRGGRAKGMPEALYGFRPDRVVIIPLTRDKVATIGYLYVPEGQSTWYQWSESERRDALNREERPVLPILPEDMMHVKLPNPGDPLEGMGYGLSPISALARSGDVDNMITAYLKEFFERGTSVSGVLSTDTRLDENTVSRIRERWKDVYGGYKNWDEIVVLEAGLKYTRTALTFDEMGFEVLDERNETRILGPFGVPPILIGSRVGLARATYANYEEARKAFWEDTMVPELRLFETEYQYYLQGDDGTWVQFDLTDVPALQKNMSELVEGYAKLVNHGVPKSMAGQIMNLGLGELDYGDVIYMPISLVPVGGPSDQYTPRLPQPPPGDGSDDGDDGQPVEAEDDERDKRKYLPAPGEAGRTDSPFARKGWTANQKAALWKANDTIAESWEAQFAEAARKALEQDKRAILAMAGEVGKAAVQQKATIEWQSFVRSVEHYLSKSGKAPGAWRQTFAPMIQGVVVDQGDRWAQTLGIQFDVENIFATQWYDTYMLKFSQQPLATTNRTIAAIGQQGMAEGWSVPKMQKHLTQTFQAWIDGNLAPGDFDWFTERMPPYRTEMIARTETIRASNAGTDRLFDEWGVREKEWLATLDGRERPEHAAANGQVVEQGEAFSVGGERLKFPGDPAGSPWNTINCRCTQLPVIAEGEVVGA